MTVNAIDAFQQAIAAIGLDSLDPCEQDAAYGAVARIEAAGPSTMEAALKLARDELFALKGPLFDSTDRREAMLRLREQCREKAAAAIKQSMLQRDTTTGPQRFARSGAPGRSTSRARPGTSRP